MSLAVLCSVGSSCMLPSRTLAMRKLHHQPCRSPVRRSFGVMPRRDLLQRSCRATEDKEAAEDPTPFFDPLLRSLVLGISAGALCESAHVALEFGTLAAQEGYSQLLEALPMAADQFAPLFVWDHVAAVGSWVLLYVVEAVAIMSVIERYPNEPQTALRVVKNMKTFSKKMLPIKLQFMKAMLLRADRTGLATVNASISPAALPASPSPTSTSPDLQSLKQKLGPMLFSKFQSSSTSVLDRPTVLDRPVPANPTKKSSSNPTSASPKPKQPSQTDQQPAPAREGKLAPGKWDPNSSSYAARQKEIADRQAYLKNFWYAAALSQNVKDEPVGVDILGRRVVLFRDEEGKVQCMDDACPHRGAPLSDGWVTKVEGHDCVVCPYHGWAFDGQGKLRDVPSLEEHGKWPRRPLVETYPVEERGGFIWMFFGSKGMPVDERPPIPFAPELEDPNWKAVYGEIEFECGHWAVFENAIDMAHIHYLHNDSFGNSENPVIHDMQMKRDAFGVTGSFRIHNKPVNAMWEFTKVESVPVEAKAMLPSSSCITIQLGAGVSMVTFVNTVPISANRSVNRFALIRNFAGWDGFDDLARKAMFRILGEDKVMVEKLRPELVKQEVSLRADMPQIAFRKLRQEYIDMGYGMPPCLPDQRRSNPDF